MYSSSKSSQHHLNENEPCLFISYAMASKHSHSCLKENIRQNQDGQSNLAASTVAQNASYKDRDLKFGIKSCTQLPM